jgi:hypothetical protein
MLGVRPASLPSDKKMIHTIQIHPQAQFNKNTVMSSNIDILDTLLQPQLEHRSFTAEYKQQTLAEADACENGSLVAFLRCEVLYYSHLNTWRERRSQAQIDRLRSHKCGPKKDQVAAHIEQL